MRLADLLNPDRIALDRNVSSKKSLLEASARLLGGAPDAAPGREIFQGLCQRERLGSTGLGHGVAIPHCRVEQPSASGALVRLKRPIDFDSPDAEPVDLFFALAVPSTCSEGHLKLLAGIAELFSDPGQRDRLRGLDSVDEVIRVLNDFEP